jgi:predicted dehydrogenase
VQHKHTAILEEHGYLAKDISTPSADFINNLLTVLGEEGSIIVYNATFERSRLLDFVRDNPLWEPAISGLINRMVDLMDVFRKKQYYLPVMGYGYSIKSVLPALFPEEGYEGLAISDGMEAANAFYQLNQENNPEKIRATRAALEAYCSMDTLAMVKIIDHIRKCIQ